jgi:hypothetical protein
MRCRFLKSPGMLLLCLVSWTLFSCRSTTRSARESGALDARTTEAQSQGDSSVDVVTRDAASFTVFTSDAASHQADASSIDATQRPDASSTTSPTSTVDPRFAVEGSLNLEPEGLLPMPYGNGQVQNLQATNEWLYFSGRINRGTYPEAEAVDGMGVFRMKKQPEARPEALFAANVSTFYYRYHWDGARMYYLDWERLRVWEETQAGVLPTFTDVTLDASYDFLAGDDDSVFAYANNCTRIVRIEKATLTTTVWQPPNAFAAGGTWGLTSAGKTIYCTGLQESGKAVVYVIDKATSTIKELAITHAGNSNHLFMAPGFIEEGNLLQIIEPFYFGKLDLTNGTITTLASNPGGWSTLPIHRDTGTPYVYIVGIENVWRLNRTDNTFVPLVNHNMNIAGRSSLDQNYVYYVTGYDSTYRPKDFVGIVRLEKP